MFDILRSMSEKLSACHMDTVIKLNDIIKELVKYQEEHKSKQKQVRYPCLLIKRLPSDDYYSLCF